MHHDEKKSVLRIDELCELLDTVDQTDCCLDDGQTCEGSKGRRKASLDNHGSAEGPASANNEKEKESLMEEPIVLFSREHRPELTLPDVKKRSMSEQIDLQPATSILSLLKSRNRAKKI